MPRIPVDCCDVLLLTVIVTTLLIYGTLVVLVDLVVGDLLRW